MNPVDADNWTPVALNSLIYDVIAAVESGEVDSAFDNVDITPGNLTRSKNTRNYTKNYLMACLQAGVQGVSGAGKEAALGLVNAFRRMNAEPPFVELPQDYRVFAVKLPCGDGNPDVEIYIKEGNKVLYGEKILPRGILTENFLSITGVCLV
jgi:hypothetical protein